MMVEECNPSRLPDDGRTESDDHRIAIHEASHAVVMRFVSGHPLEGATVDPGEGFAGRVWGEKSHVAELTGINVHNLSIVIDKHLPKPGEPNAYLADVFLDAFNRCIGVVAGTVGENLFIPEGRPWLATSDELKADAYSGLLCKSDAGANYLRLACKAEAERILLENKDVVTALAAELRLRRTLNGEQIDKVIQRVTDQRAHADALARRAAWRQIAARAAG